MIDGGEATLRRHLECASHIKLNNNNNIKQLTTMIYFFSSSRKDDKLVHPVTVSTTNEKRAFALAVINFKKHSLKGTPIKI